MYIDDYKIVNRSFWEKLFSLNWTTQTKKVPYQRWVRTTPHPARVSDAKILTSTERSALAAHSAQKLNEKQKLANAAKRSIAPTPTPRSVAKAEQDDSLFTGIVIGAAVDHFFGERNASVHPTEAPVFTSGAGGDFGGGGASATWDSSPSSTESCSSSYDSDSSCSSSSD